MHFPTRYSILILFFPLFTCGCKKNKNGASNSNGPSGTIIGVWELREASASLSTVLYTYAAGNGHILEFIGTNYKIYKSGSVIKSGQFTVVQDTTVSTSICLVFPKDQYTDRIIYDSNYAATKTFYQIEGDSLTFYSGCYAYDAGHNEVYVRVN